MESEKIKKDTGYRSGNCDHYRAGHGGYNDSERTGIMCGKGSKASCLFRQFLLTVLLMFLSAAALPAAAFAKEKQVSSGIFVEGIDVGGMTEEEMKAAVRQKVDELAATPVTLTIDGQEITAFLSDFGLTWANESITDEILTLGTTGTILQRYKDQKDIEKDKKEYSLTFRCDPEMVKNYAKTCSSYDTEPVNARIYTTDELLPGVEGGTNGIRVRVDETAERIEEAVNGWDGESEIRVEIPADSIAPDIPYEELAMICDPLGTATTDYSSSSYGRAVNIENGCSKITGTLIYPGESFSVTAAVTPFTAENGYEPAPSYEENRVVDSYGGGICQVSTTLYNAVLKAELEVISRSNHTMAVSYVDLSKDAAIAEGVMDFAFVNSKEEPVYIIGYAYGGTISFTIYGHETRPANRSIEFESITTGTMEPSAAMLYPNASQPVGYMNQTQSPHTGYTAELWKHIYIDGVLTDSVQINSSYYNAVGTIYDIGVASENAALTQAMYAAIATNDLAQVQGVIANGANYGKTAEQSETTADTSQQAEQPAQTSQEEVSVQPEYSEGGEAPAAEAPPAEVSYDTGEGGGDVVIMPDWDE